MLQLSVTPCYALTIHKTQALSIKHTVRGCLEGVFAFGPVVLVILWLDSIEGGEPAARRWDLTL